MERKKSRFNFNPKPYNPRPFRQAPSLHPRQPQGHRPAPFTPFRAQRQTRLPIPEEEEEEYYWTIEQWEAWAEDQYLNNPDAQLPEWFIEAMEEEEEE